MTQYKDKVEQRGKELKEQPDRDWETENLLSC